MFKTGTFRAVVFVSTLPMVKITKCTVHFPDLIAVRLLRIHAKREFRVVSFLKNAQLTHDITKRQPRTGFLAH